MPLKEVRKVSNQFELKRKPCSARCSLDGIVALAYGYPSDDAGRLCLLVLSHVLGHQITAQTETNRHDTTLTVLLIQMIYHGCKILGMAIGENPCRGNLDTAECSMWFSTAQRYPLHWAKCTKVRIYTDSELLAMPGQMATVMSSTETLEMFNNSNALRVNDSTHLLVR